MNFDSLPRVGFLNKIIPAPAVFPRAEDAEDDGTYGKNEVTHDEVFQIHDGRTAAERMERGQQIRAEGASRCKDEHQGCIDKTGLPAGHAGQFHEHCRDILENAKNRRERGKSHENEKERAENPAVRHMVEDAR